MDEADLREILGRMNPSARDAIRRMLIQDQPYRDQEALRLGASSR